MSYNLELKTKTFAEDVGFLDSQHRRYIRGGVTIDKTTVEPNEAGKRILPAGSFLGQVAETGKYGPYDSEAEDGRDVAVCILAETVDVTEYDQVTTALDHARVIVARLPVPPSADVKAQLKDILFV